MKKISIFLITVALIAGMVGCGEVTPPTRYSLAMAVAPAGNGTATDLTNASPYTAGTGVSIKAVAATGCQFVNWTAQVGTFANATAAQTTFTMPAQNVTVIANFFQGQLIRTWYDLDAIRNDLGDSYLVMNDLDSTTAGYDALVHPDGTGGEGWEPIGNGGFPFVGSFDGQGYEIRDLFIDRPDEDYVGLFGHVEGGVIKDIGVANITVIGDCFVGGLVGHNGGTVSDSYSTGSVTGDSVVGGLVGENGGIVSNSYFSGSVTGNDFVGGLAGDNAMGTLGNSYFNGSVTGDSEVGGLVGIINGGTVSDSYSTGSVTGDSEVGGLVGEAYALVSNSYSTGSVTGNTSVGGLVGRYLYGHVSDSYSIGNVTGNSSVGGLVGDNEGTVSNSFWNTQTSGQLTSDGGTGKTTAEMQDIATFSDMETEGLDEPWDISAVANPDTRNLSYIWNIVDNETYPFLSWQLVS